jgi:hypothetical protein
MFHVKPAPETGVDSIAESALFHVKPCRVLPFNGRDDTEVMAVWTGKPDLGSRVSAVPNSTWEK